MSEEFGILVTGPRTWTDEDKLYQELDLWFAFASVTGHTPVMYNGMAEYGVDWMAFKWAKRIAGYEVREFPADWRKWGPNLAGFYRNQEMVDAGPKMGIAFLKECELLHCRKPKPHWTHGTDDCRRRIVAAGIDLVEVRET